MMPSHSSMHSACRRSICSAGRSVVSWPRRWHLRIRRGYARWFSRARAPKAHPAWSSGPTTSSPAWSRPTPPVQNEILRVFYADTSSSQQAGGASLGRIFGRQEGRDADLSLKARKTQYYKAVLSWGVRDWYAVAKLADITQPDAHLSRRQRRHDSYPSQSHAGRFDPERWHRRVSGRVARCDLPVRNRDRDPDARVLERLRAG